MLLLDVEYLAWRITLDRGPTVLHLGDVRQADLFTQPGKTREIPHQHSQAADARGQGET